MTPPLMKKIAFVPLIAAIAGLLYLPFYGDADLGQMQVQALAGRVEVVRDGETLVVEDRLELEIGDLIRTSDDGAGKLRLIEARKAWLDEDSSVVVTGTKSLESRSGDVIVESLADPIGLSFGEVEVTAGRGRFRIEQALGSAVAASLGGSWRLNAPGQAPLRLESFFQASVPAGRLPRQAKPYQLNDDDRWGAQFEVLASVFDLDQELETRATTLSSQLSAGSSRPGLSYFESLAGEEVPFMSKYLSRPTDDLLIGFTVAQTSRKITSVRAAVDEAFELSDAGGRWGVVAEIMKAREKVLVAQLDTLLVGSGIIAGTGETDSEPVFALTAPGGELQPGAALDEVFPGSDGVIVSDPVVPPGSDPEPPEEGEEPPPGGEEPGEGEEPSDCDSNTECAAEEIIDRLPPSRPSPSPSPSPSGGLLHGVLSD